MHIGFLTPEYPHHSSGPSGGLGTSIKNMVEALVAKGVEVSIILYGQKTDKNLSENGIQFYFISQKTYPVGGWYLYRKILEKKILEIIRESKINLLEAPDWTGITAFMKFKIPLVIRMNGTDAYFCSLDKRKQKFKNRFFERTALENADKILSVSDFTGWKTMEILKLNRSYKVIPNSISIENFKSSGRHAQPNRILYFGTIIRKKGVLELAQIFNEVIKHKEEAKLILAGRDVEDIFESISTLELFKKKLTIEAAKSFEHVGSLDYRNIRKEIEKASVVVLPSFAEALPMTWLEAMAMEKALVTSDIGWAPEVMINGETGFMVDPKNHRPFAEKIRELLDDKELVKNMGQAARERVIKKFSTEVVVEKNISFYKETVDQWRTNKQ